MLEKISGLKTYAACVGIIAVSAAKYFSIIDGATFISALGVLVPMGGMFMRAGVAKAHKAADAVADALEKLDEKLNK